MILTHSDYVERLRRDGAAGFDFDMAQTVASWWYSPGAPALVTFTTQGKIIAGLADEVDHEREGATSAADRDDLYLLAAWVRAQGVDPVDEHKARAELITLLDEMRERALTRGCDDEEPTGGIAGDDGTGYPVYRVED